MKNKEYIVKQLLSLMSIVVLIFLAGCAATLPKPNDSGKGIAVIPMKVSDHCQWHGFSFDYELRDPDKGPEVLVFIKPMSGQEYVMSHELEPGNYVLATVDSVFDISSGLSTNQRRHSRRLEKLIRFEIKAGTATIVRNELNIYRKNTDPESCATYFTVGTASPETRKEISLKLKSAENGNLWNIEH